MIPASVGVGVKKSMQHSFAIISVAILYRYTDGKYRFFFWDKTDVEKVLLWGHNLKLEKKVMKCNILRNIAMCLKSQ